MADQQPEAVESPAATTAPRPVLPLQYAGPMPRPPARDITPWLREPLGYTAVACGVLMALAQINSWLPAGLGVAVGGAGWVVLQKSIRKGGGAWLLGAQVFLASLVIGSGLFGAASVAHSASPTGWVYWLTENQTYRWTRSVALRELWTCVPGLAWLAAVAGLWLLRLARARRARNNLPPQQEH